MNKRSFDGVVVGSIITVSLLLFLIYNINSMLYAILSLGLPSLYLLFKVRKIKNTVKNVIVFSLLAGAGLIVVFYFANIYSVWFVPSLFEFRPLNQALEEVFFAVFWPMEILLIYEYFFANNYKKILRWEFILKVVTALWMVFIIGLALGIYENLNLPYPYTVLILIFGIPPIFFIRNKKNDVIVNLLKIGAVYFVIHLVWELVALEAGMWEWPGSYIGFVSVFGFVFPFEEFFIWVLLGAPLVCLIYENFLIKKTE